MATSTTAYFPKVQGYIIAEKLGAGSFADVYKAFKKGEKKDIVAIKCVDKTKLSKTAENNLVSEIKILKSLCHDNIVKLKDFTWDDSHIFIIMEYCSGGNLLTFIHQRIRLSENICQRFLQQLALALQYLREKNISHFDLKPQNIFLASKNLQVLKIGDFGLAQYISEKDKNSLVKGSPLYMAPEIVLKREYDARADIWSVGVILYECLFGKAPYSSKTFDELISKIKSDKSIDVPANASISTDCRDFLTRSLQRELSRRLTFSEFFNHQFVDLKHAANSNSINEATTFLNRAVQEDKNNNYSNAFTLYNEAIRYLVPVMHIEKDSNKRMNLRKKICMYVNRMENLKEKIKLQEVEGDLASLEVPSLASLVPKKLIYEGSLTELMQLTTTTPQITTAIEIAQSAELYEKEKSYSTALEKYEMALGKLISLLQNEPKGRRRDLLVEEINRWMYQAECIKTIQKEDCSSHLSDVVDEEKTCSIQ